MIDLAIYRFFDFPPVSLHWRQLVCFRCGCQMMRPPDGDDYRLALMPQCNLRHDYDPELRALDPLAPPYAKFHCDLCADDATNRSRR
jgi:hypothetical protein